MVYRPHRGVRQKRRLLLMLVTYSLLVLGFELQVCTIMCDYEQIHYKCCDYKESI